VLRVETRKYLFRGGHAHFPIRAAIFLAQTNSEEARRSRNIYFKAPEEREGAEEDSVIAEVNRGGWRVVSRGEEEG
jgi:hypothetical protein